MNFTIPALDWFTNGNPYGGNRGLFNYSIKPANGLLCAYIWYGKLCQDKSEIIRTSEFPLTVQGLESAKEFIEAALEVFVSAN